MTERYAHVSPAHLASFVQGISRVPTATTTATGGASTAGESERRPEKARLAR
jgi:hypothetical protein